MTDLRVPLASLPRFDPVGLDLTRTILLVGAPLTGPARLLWPCVRQPDGGLGLWDGDVVQPIDPANWSVDLSDAATRDRCARWLAQRVGLEVGCTAPAWWRWTPSGGGWALAVGTPFGADRAHVWPCVAPIGTVDAGEQTWHPGVVGGLNPTDDRRLPDGSRWVDAAALALVCRAQGVARG